MNSFTYFGAGSAIDDPDQSVYEGSLQFYNLMNGLLPRPEWPNGQPWTDPITGEETVFVLSGDPVSGTGWVDGIQLPPGDRRMVMASGPFMMSRGDTAEVVLGIVGGLGLDQLSSVSQAKFHDITAQYAYNVDFDLPSAPKSPVASGYGMDRKVTLDWGFNEDAVAQTETPIYKGFEFEGYVVYQLPSGSSPISEGVKLATFDRINEVLAVSDDAVDLVTGEIVSVAKQIGSDNGIQRFYHTDYDEIRGRPMSNGITYYFAITAYNVIPSDVSAPPPFKTLESAATIVAVTPSSINPGFVYSESGMSEVEHAVGTADATVEINIANPDSVVGGDYEVTFVAQEYTKGVDGIWLESSPGRVVGKTSDCTGSTVSAAVFPNFAADGTGTGTLDLVLSFNMSCGTNWVDGVLFTIPTDIGSVNSWAITGTGGLCGSGSDGSSGQNCNNLDGTYDASTGELLFGTENTGYGWGAFEGSNEFTVNYTPASSDFSAISVPFVIYDDNYDGTEVNAVGTAVTPDNITLETKIEYHWYLKNLTSNTMVREMQTFVGGTDIYGGNSVRNMSAPFLSFGNSLSQVPSEGFQIFIDGSYDAPISFSDQSFTYNQLNAALYGASSYDITDYQYFGFPNAKATDIIGVGTSDINTLQKDIEFRFTGEFDDIPMDTIFYDVDYSILSSGPSADTVLYYSGTVEKNGGSYAWLIGANGYSLADHPEAPADYEDGAAVRIWIPFEVWDMEARDDNGVLIDGGVQIDIAVIDRFQGWDQTLWAPMNYIYNVDDPCCAYSWNPYTRMYTFNIHAPYQEDGEYLDATGENIDWGQYATWNLVWLESQFNQGDVVNLKYDNPIQAGVDKFTFSTTKKATTTDITLDNVSVYPNPYYGFHQLETSRGDKYVSFNNLPPTATIDIYSLGGVFVRSLKHGSEEQTSNGQFARWDLNNQYGYPVASGLYLARIKSDGAKEKVLKIALVQETQVLKYY